MKTIYLGLIMTENRKKVVAVLTYETALERKAGWQAIDATWSINNPYNFYMWFVDVTIDSSNHVTSIIEYTHLEPIVYPCIMEALNKLGIK